MFEIQRITHDQQEIKHRHQQKYFPKTKERQKETASSSKITRLSHPNPARSQRPVALLGMFPILFQINDHS